MPKVVHIPPVERWNAKTEEFEYPFGQEGVTLTLEHSLISIYKWEAKWHKPFITKVPHSNEEAIDYIKCMTLTQNVKPEVYDCIPEDVMKEITDYIDDPMTATNFSEMPSSSNRKSLREEKITAELVYYWMIAFHIPFECRKWHFEQLMTLIEVCSRKTEEANDRAEHKGNRGMKAPKLSPSAISNRQRLNEQRMKAYGKG